MKQLKRIGRTSGKSRFRLLCWSWLAIASGLGLTACEPSELRPVPTLPSGGGFSAPQVPAAPAAPLAPPLAYTEDPETMTEDWEDYVWADNAQQATRKCNELAASYTAQGGTPVTVVRVRQTSQKGLRWACVFRG